MTIAFLTERFSDQTADCTGLAALGPGTLISTTEGDLPVEWLASGDKVITRDYGAQPLRWIGYWRLSARQLATTPTLRPVLIEPGSFGPGAPNHPLALSRGQQIFVDGPEVQYYLGVDTALAAAGYMTDVDAGFNAVHNFTYFQLLFDVHQVIRANGLWTESLFAGDETPGLCPPPDIRHDATAHRCLAGWEARMLHQTRCRAVSDAARRAA